MIIYVPQDKQADILQHICSVLFLKSISAANLQSLAGKLNFLVKAFPLGHPFIHCLYDCAAGKHPCRQIPISEELQCDWQLWGAFLTQFQGWLPILDREQWKKAIMVVYSDASANPKLGWGVYVPIKGWWSYGQWNSHHMQMNNPSIDFLEMFAILVFLDMKGVDLHDMIIHFKLSH